MFTDPHVSHYTGRGLVINHHVKHYISRGLVINRELQALLSQCEHRDCKQDHGERTNRKLKDQPFYQRGRTGKMKTY